MSFDGCLSDVMKSWFVLRETIVLTGQVMALMIGQAPRPS